MKKVFISNILILSITLILSSCGRWSDNIHLSTKSAEFSADGDSLIVTTKGSTWMISGITVDSEHFYNFDGIDILASSYTIKQDCFTIERRDRNTFSIKLEANPLNVKRIVIIEIEDGDYFDRVTITQNPK
jgi:hypothetical protein